MLNDGDLHLEQDWQRILADDYSHPRYHITFVGLPGSQELIEMTGESAVPGSVAYVTAVDDNGEPYEQVGNTEELECSGRGACDKASGICKCFAGYFGAACDHQNALVM